jgi:hypothetical protein
MTEGSEAEMRRLLLRRAQAAEDKWQTEHDRAVDAEERAEEAEQHLKHSEARADRELERAERAEARVAELEAAAAAFIAEFDRQAYLATDNKGHARLRELRMQLRTALNPSGDG